MYQFPDIISIENLPLDNVMNVALLLFLEELSGVEFFTWSMNLCTSYEVDVRTQ